MLARTPGTRVTDSEVEEFREGLLRWFEEHRRELPWRQAGDPYAVWVSEIMLQQTRVATVMEYFDRWMGRFPTVEDLAAAPVEEVLKLWAGLGYYGRARRLHEAAGQVVARGGEVPSTVDELRELPGVGPYTAGAIASIAFGRVAPLVDGNVIRVLTRWAGIEGDPGKGAAKREIWRLAGELVDRDQPGDFNQALMEVGSLVCTPRSPKCEECPIATGCVARAGGEQERFPQLPKRVEPKAMRGRCGVVSRQGGGGREVLLRRRPGKGLLGGLWEFPGVEAESTAWPTLGELKGLLESGPIEAVERPRRAFGEVEHVFSHRHLRLRIHGVEADPGAAMEGWRWVPEEELEQLQSSALFAKVVAAIVSKRGR